MTDPKKPNQPDSIPRSAASGSASGELSALDGLLTQTEWVQRLAAQVVTDPNDRDDVVQRAWLSAIEGLPALEGGAPRQPKAWFATILRNSFRKMHRDESLRRRREGEVPPPQSSPPTPEEIVQQATLHKEVVDAVLSLEEPYRSTILLRYFEGLAPQVIATQTGTSRETVATRLKRARERLRRSLEGRFGGDPRPLAVILLPLLGVGFARSVVAATAASSTISPAPASSALSPWIGGVLMSANVKIALSLVTVIALLLFLWPGEEPEPKGSAAKTPTETSTPADDPRVAAQKSFTETEGSAETTAVRNPASSSAETAEETPTTEAGELYQLGGIVVDVDGKPVADALVLLADPSLGTEWSSPESLGRLGLSLLDGKIPDEVMATVSDAEGRFELAAVPPGTRWSVAALHEIEGVSLLTGVPVSAELAPVEVELAFGGGLSLFGRVTDASGEPVAGARVGIGGHRETPDGWVGTMVASATTDERGEYRIFRLPYPRMNISASKSGYCGSNYETISIDDSPDMERGIDLVLGARRRLSGPLVATDGLPLNLYERAPLPSIDAALSAQYRWILCLTHDDPRTRPAFDPVNHHTRGEIDGENARYSIEFCDEGTFLSVWRGSILLGLGELSSKSKEGDTTGPEEGPEIALDFTALKDAEPTDGVLLLRVIDAETTEAIPGALIKLAALRNALDARSIVRNATADPNGVHAARGLAYGLQDVVVEAEGYAPFREVFEIGAPPEKEGAPWEIALSRPNATLRGTIVDRSGEPVHDARLYLCFPSGLPAIPGYNFRSSNLDGAFEFTDIAPGEYLVAVEGEGIAAAVVTANTAASDPIEITVEAGVKVDLRPKPAEGFSQRVLDAQGLPLYDDRRSGSQRYGGSSVRLVPGVPVTLEIHCIGHEVFELDFTPSEEQGPLEFDLVPVGGGGAG